MASLRKLYPYICLSAGFWDLTHEKRGSLAAANTLVVLVLLTVLIRLGGTSFVFLDNSNDDPDVFFKPVFPVKFIRFGIVRRIQLQFEILHRFRVLLLSQISTADTNICLVIVSI